MKSQGDWIRSVKSGGCTACHALGNKATREIPAALGPFHDSVAGVGSPGEVGPGGRGDVQRAQQLRQGRAC